MNVYVESNFVLEMALMQEQQASCENILWLCETGKLRVIVPAYSLVEPYETMIRRERDRRSLLDRFEKEAGQLLRSKPYKTENDVMQQVAILLNRSLIEENSRLDQTVERLVKTAEIIPLSAEILTAAQEYRRRLRLSPQDAVVYASVIRHLAGSPPASHCFLNRNSRDFNEPDIKDEIRRQSCKILFSFDTGLAYIQSQLTGP